MMNICQNAKEKIEFSSFIFNIIYNEVVILWRSYTVELSERFGYIRKNNKVGFILLISDNDL